MKKYASLLIVMLLVIAIVPVNAQDLLFEVGEGDFTWDSYQEFADANDFTGETVTISGPWLTADQESFENVFAYFEAATGADIVYAGSDSFEQQIVIDLEAGSPPNIAAFPQPGLATNMAERGFLIPLGDDMEQWVLDNYAAGESWVDLGTYADENGEDQFYGFFYNVNLKSIVWYSPDNFTDAGYEVPTTMEDLIALSEQMVADGETPWCIGLGSGDATGWPATDWVEDIMLRTQPPEVYDAWVTNELPFTAPEVINALETFGMFAKNDEWVNGGAASVASTDFRDAPAGLFTVPPECYMHRQASFISGFFPEDVEVGVDADFFYFPGFAESDMDLGSPVLGGGTLLAMTDDTEATRAFFDFLTLPLAHEIWMAQVGFLTPHSGVNLDTYADSTLRGQGEILLGATTFRFDGSDLMPGAIGQGAFWTGMVDFVSGASAEEVAQQIQDAWDAIKEE
ncbi:MAG: alpha-glucoside ABC transporter substrate-binding protein [Anaerolineaceae bacterium]|nr:alpha-glucoside ABC transporter substrate-binding protein [Anaerolineaceae bacterium]